MMKLYWSGVGPKSKDYYSYKETQTHTHTRMKTEAETREMRLEAKEHQGLLATGRDGDKVRKGFFPEPLERGWSCQYLLSDL